MTNKKVVLDFIPLNGKTKEDKIKFYEIKLGESHEEELNETYNYEKDVSITTLYANKAEKIYYNKDNNNFWYINFVELTPEHNLSWFKNILPVEVKEIDSNNLWFRLYNNWDVEIIDYTNGIWKWESYYLSPIENFDFHFIKDNIIRFIEDSSDVDKEEKVNLIECIKDKKDINGIDEIIGIHDIVPSI